jgi:hypothetical protein
MVDMSAPRCRYATEPGTRPDCQLTAVVRRGRVALCASCDALRSTLGKGQAPARLPAAPPIGPLDWVTQAQAQLRAAEAELAAAVIRARQAGQTWTAIGASLGITRQAAQQRFDHADLTERSRSGRTRRPPGQPSQSRSVIAATETMLAAPATH